ncbi:MAG: hypothetical protein RL318_702 [Fibrobacterota bacterium]|jgi:hypothetical protein
MLDRLASTDFHVQHGAFGAYGSFTLGKFGATGGFTVHDGRKPGSDDVYVGILAEDGTLQLMPFFKAAGRGTEAFAVREEGKELHVAPWGACDVTRALGWGSDAWTAEGLQLRLDTPLWPVPDPAHGEGADFVRSVLPAVTGELRVDNRHGQRPVLAIVGVCGEELGSRLHEGPSMKAWSRQEREGLATSHPKAIPFAGFSLEKCLGRNLLVRAPHVLGACFGLAVRVEPGEELVMPLAFGWHVEGKATTGLETQYAYARHCPDLESVLGRALEEVPLRAERCRAMDRELQVRVASSDRRFLLAHASRAYLACSELLRETDGRLAYVVNEGEYCMMNTLDLSVDHAFFEAEFFPWASGNVLDLFLRRHSFTDRVKVPDLGTFPGGLSFCHDMGVRNVFSAPGTSCYEIPEKDRCFSHMTCEELCNWVLLAGIHGLSEAGKDWLGAQSQTLLACQESLLVREHPDPASREGWFGTDSDRCGEGVEITTYDSLDASLARARGSLYLAVKAWACHLALARMLARAGLTESVNLSEDAARRIARAVEAVPLLDNGCLPAHFTGSQSAILPAVEPLIYPWWWGDRDAVSLEGRFGGMIKRLKAHLVAALKPGVCISPEGAWRLSSTSSMTWMSKSFLVQAVMENVLGMETDARVDTVHARWQREGVGGWGFTDQIVDGKDVGSRLYPRGVAGWAGLRS